MSINHIILIYCLLYMINVTQDHARVNILDVEKCKNIFLLSKVSHTKSNPFYMYSMFLYVLLIQQMVISLIPALFFSFAGF